ncbi:male-specific histamine-binding salivary protein-like [Dermacentor variabilis]|uniref:male-specific histamine-binding salivary protein-like n=1 Tax=Dermacentor variabilis TaxID=34621 RepID=UPI003F5BF97D
MMQVAILLSLFGAALAASGGKSSGQSENPLWQNEDLVGSYQNAWKSIGQESNVTYVLAKTTYENDTGSWGQQFKCLSVKETNKNETAQTVQSVFTFRNASSVDNEYYNVTETVQAVSTHGYNKTKNAIREQNFTDPLIFSDGEVCDVFYVPYQGNGCELWVRKENVSSIPDCCLFVFNVFCAQGNTVYDKYNETECAAVAASEGVASVQSEKPLWANEDLVGKYQNVWQFAASHARSSLLPPSSPDQLPPYILLLLEYDLPASSIPGSLIKL